MARPLVLLALVLAALLAAPATAHGKSNRYYPIVHTVRPNQTLLGIAHRWNVTLDALCHANDISHKKPIRPGQELVVPAREDKDGKQARKLRDQGFLESKTRRDELRRQLDEEATRREEARLAAEQAEQKQRARAEGAKERERAHAKAEAERRERQASGRGREDSKRSAQAKPDAQQAKQSRGRQAKRAAFEKDPKRRNFVRLSGLMGRWEGVALDAKGQPTAEAKSGFRRVLRSWRTGKATEINPRLIQLLVRVSNHFGGRTLVVVSGYRPESISPHSLHNAGDAVDFKVEGVPNEVVRDYLRRLPRAGVGYYPNSTHVHLDTRATGSYWIDYSGPGEKPRYAHQGYVDRYGPPRGQAPNGSNAAAAGPKSSGPRPAAASPGH